MGIKGVTPRQMEEVRRIAKEKGVGSQAFDTHALDNGNIRVLMEAAKLGRKLTLYSDLMAPIGGHVEIVTVPVNPGRQWADAVKAGGPNSSQDNNVWEVGDQYPPRAAGFVRDEEIILVNFGSRGAGLKRANMWADMLGLKPTEPRFVFAIGEYKHELHREFKMDPMFIIATQHCEFGGYSRVCSVWWEGNVREADLYLIEFCERRYGWYAYCRAESYKP